MINRALGDRVSSNAGGSSFIGLMAAAAESTRLRGVFHFQCTAPDSHDLPEMLRIRDARDAAWAVRNWSEYARLDDELLLVPQKEIWRDSCPNLVTTVGKNLLLDNGFSQNFVSTYMMLMSNASYTTGAAVGDTMASHGGWTESTAYSNSTRVVTAWSAAASGSKALSAALAFNINGTDTIKGAGLTTVSTKGGTTGILYSMGLFTGGDQPVVNGNTLNVSYTASA